MGASKDMPTHRQANTNHYFYKTFQKLQDVHQEAKGQSEVRVTIAMSYRPSEAFVEAWRVW